MTRRQAAMMAGAPFLEAEENYPVWPIFDSREENALSAVLRSGKWGRLNGSAVAGFEQEFAAKTGSPHCLAVANGTSALLTAMGVLDIGPGDEVIVPPYTFIATVNAVLRFHAVPVFADIDPKSMQMDPKSVAAQITPRTRAIVMVHMAGGVGELGKVLEIGKKHGIPVIEDAAQAHLAEFGGKHVGTLGAMGCFSFQASKNLNSGEGGALLTADQAMAEKAYAFHNNSRTRPQKGEDFHYQITGANLRLTEFQGAMLSAQMSRIEEQAKRRTANALRLDAAMAKIDGFKPSSVSKECTRNAYHLYMFHYDAKKFGGRTRAEFLKYAGANGVPVSAGYSPLEEEPFLENAFRSRGYEFAYGKNYFAKWKKRNDCPANRKACAETAWFTQTVLLSGEKPMARIEKMLAGWAKS